MGLIDTMEHPVHIDIVFTHWLRPSPIPCFHGQI